MKTCLQIAAVSVGLFPLIGCANKSITAQLQRYAYTEIRPPSRLTPPGTIILITHRKPLQGNTVCPADKALGQRVSRPEFTAASDSASAEMARAFTGSFKLDGGYLEQLKLSAKFEAVKSLKLSLSNVKLLELSDVSVFKLIKDRDPDCARAIQFRRNEQQELTMINYALVADAQYTISWSRKLETAVKADITKEVAANLGVEVAWSGEDSFKGANLIWGVRDDAALLKISVTNLLSTGVLGHSAKLPIDQPLLLKND